MSACQPPSTSPMRQRSSTLDVVEEDDVRPLAGQRVHRLHLDARLIERQEEHRRAGVLRGFALRAGEEEDVVGHVGVRREHLLPVDDPPVAVPASSGAHTGDVGPDLGLGHAEGDGDLAPQEPGQDLGLQLVGADRADDAGHHLRRADGDDRRLGLRQLVVDGRGPRRGRAAVVRRRAPRPDRPTLARPAGGRRSASCETPLRYTCSSSSGGSSRSRNARTSSRKATGASRRGRSPRSGLSGSAVAGPGRAAVGVARLAPHPGPAPRPPVVELRRRTRA